ncbi:hypothetical protein ENSA7_15080 [Enhygromyxa salina]|uniref:DarT domain-containing protein n=1 Tax=Enhygromyxa salina TaxID=215803 RepID=A0A2S9YUV9_9BACT|nr:DarT ssDNA thymidine ADP-ribosyltransferase family protein [Enhygromyxa salina]PRQ08874.1 hypothetical protein ENSA7_15080 [Enhygromyxa salina]
MRHASSSTRSCSAVRGQSRPTAWSTTTRPLRSSQKRRPSTDVSRGCTFGHGRQHNTETKAFERASEQRWHGAHCPVPVFFCFNLAALLSRTGVCFSNGSMARPEVVYGDSLELFETIPFELVYHDRSISSDEDKSLITFHRHAEILVPDRLGLEHLVAIACRTGAERQTLLHGLSAAARTKWESRIRVVGDRLFLRQWPHLDGIYWANDMLHLRFAALSPTSVIPVGLQASELGTSRAWTWSGQHQGNSDLKLRLPRAPTSKVELEVEVRIHNCVAFRALVAIHDEAPF